MHDFMLFVVLSLFTTGSPTQAEYFLAALGEPTMKIERTKYNVKSWNGIGLYQLSYNTSSSSLVKHLNCRRWIEFDKLSKLGKLSNVEFSFSFLMLPSSTLQYVKILHAFSKKAKSMNLLKWKPFRINSMKTHFSVILFWL